MIEQLLLDGDGNTGNDIVTHMVLKVIFPVVDDHHHVEQILVVGVLWRVIDATRIVSVGQDIIVVVDIEALRDVVDALFLDLLHLDVLPFLDRVIVLLNGTRFVLLSEVCFHFFLVDFRLSVIVRGYAGNLIVGFFIVGVLFVRYEVMRF